MTKSQGIRRRVTGTLEERFWAHTERRAVDECWPWLGATDQHGYGILQCGTRHKSHRLSFALNHRPLVDGEHVLHSCDNPNCVNPAHLSAGTHDDNMKDMFAKKRRRYNVPRGEASGKHKLTDAQVDEILADFAGGMTQRAIAAKYSIAQSHAHRIKSGVSRGGGTGWRREGE